MKYGCKIESIGVKLPDKIVTSDEIVSQLKLSKPFRLERLTGISERRVCSDSEDSLTLATDAALDCFNYSKYKAKDIELIIFCSISKYVNGLNHCYEPALSLLLKQKIGNKKALNFDISNACAGMITGVHIANNFIARGVVKNALVVSGEYITSLYKNAIQNINSPRHTELASLTVGDAGAAVILTGSEIKEEDLAVSKMVTFSQFSNLCIAHQSVKQPGGVMKTHMKKIHDVSIKNAPPIIEKALQKAGLKMSQIDFMIPHQTAKFSIQSGGKYFAKWFKEEPAEIVSNLAKTGNTASTTHFTTMYKLLNEKRFKKGDNIMLLSFASGLVIGVNIFTINSLIDSYGNNN